MGSATAAGAARESLTDQAPNLSPRGLETLADMYSAKALLGSDADGPVPIDRTTRISIAQGAELHRLIRTNRYRQTIEIGFAYGFSTIWILDALSGLGGASHIAIDPHERGPWSGIGLRQVERLGLSDPIFRWIEDDSALALPGLIRDGTRADFVFIDGNHRFDDTLVDFYLSDKLLKPGGMIAFDDMWLESIRAVASFIGSNREYKRVETPVENMAVFRKQGPDSRPWHHFRSFRTEFRPVRGGHIRRRVTGSLPYRTLRRTAAALVRSLRRRF